MIGLIASSGFSHANGFDKVNNSLSEQLKKDGNSIDMFDQVSPDVIRIKDFFKDKCLYHQKYRSYSYGITDNASQKFIFQPTGRMVYSDNSSVGVDYLGNSLSGRGSSSMQGSWNLYKNPGNYYMFIIENDNKPGDLIPLWLGSFDQGAATLIGIDNVAVNYKILPGAAC